MTVFPYPVGDMLMAPSTHPESISADIILQGPMLSFFISMYIPTKAVHCQCSPLNQIVAF
jgi:hypothetical protein